MKTLNQEALRYIRYESDTGKLFWLERPVSMFKRPEYHSMWNKRFANKEAFTAVGSHGYKCGAIQGQHWLAHRLIFLIVGGYLPEIVDHINGDRLDNRWVNLREVTTTESSRNTCLRSDNKSGCLGVSVRPDNRWLARITVNGEIIHLGNFKELDDAIKARKSAEKKYGFHENHSRIVNRGT